MTVDDAELRRLREDEARSRFWKRWGPYLAERQWGTVREDYSADGESWGYFPHDQARSRAYRWGEDGLLGVCDHRGRLCLALALWNGRDPILKERLFGLTGPQGNHGEDVKECYYYLDSTPTHAYMKALYKYPQRAFPYEALVAENRRRTRHEREYELEDTGIFDDGRYFDVDVEYAKADVDDLLLRITVHNRGPDDAPLALLPQLWFRNTWSWGRTGEGYPPTPSLTRETDSRIAASHATLGQFALDVAPASDGTRPELIFTGNDTDAARLFGGTNRTPWVKDAFHRYVVDGARDAVNPAQVGTKAAALYRLVVPAGGATHVDVRLRARDLLEADAFGDAFDATLAARLAEADAFYATHIPAGATPDERAVARQAYAGLLWSKQFYHYGVKPWLEGDPGQPAPPAERLAGRNAGWTHLYANDVLLVPDAWEYPWFAAWDLAFHCIPMATIDPAFAKAQLVLLLREWYMHPNGQVPAYEFNFGDVNPPVHAWAAWRVYKMTGRRGARDREFLARVFHKLLLNFTWWVNRKDEQGNNLFSGGFLGLDNIGVFDRSKPLPTGGWLEQADGTGWMAFYCATMLSIALELASGDPAYQDVASKFLEHFVAIADAMNAMGDDGLWDDADGFYYDQLRGAGDHQRLRVRSMAGLLPIIACEILEPSVIARLPWLEKRLAWLLANRADLSRHSSMATIPPRRDGERAHEHRLLAIPSRERLERVLQCMLDEGEFLSPNGLRSLSRVHEAHPYVFAAGGQVFHVGYEPGESGTWLFGGNSNWRGPVWFPVNYLLVEALERYHHFYGASLTVEYPTGSGHRVTLDVVARDLQARLVRPFVPDESGRRPCHGDDARYATDPHWRDLVLFHEYFHGDDGRGLGASHQTGWTALVTRCIETLARAQGPRRSYALHVTDLHRVAPAPSAATPPPPPPGDREMPPGRTPGGPAPARTPR